jgi:hypothetical protein
MFAGVNLLLGAFVFFFIPETKQIPLEQIDAIFGGTNHVAKGEDLLTHQDPERGTIETLEVKPVTGQVENTGIKQH